MAGWNTYKRKSLVSLLAGLVLFALINLLAGRYFHRWDLTKEKRYTLTASTKEILRSLDRPIEVNVFLEGSDLPAGIKKLRNSTRELLNEFRALSGGMLTYEFVDLYEIDNPEERKAIEQFLIQGGLYPTNLEVRQEAGTSEKLIYPGAVFSSEQRDISVTILENQMAYTTQDVLNNSYNFLEHKFANAIRKLSLERPYRIAVLEGHGELENNRISDLMQTLFLQDFQVQRIDLAEQSLLASDADVVMIAKPQGAFTDIEKFEIDQFIMQGGGALWMIDKAVGDLDSFRVAPQYLAVDRPIELDDLLFRYGVRVNSDLVQDIVCNPVPVTENVNGEDQTTLYPWVFHPVVQSLEEHPVTRHMDPVMLRFVSSIDTVRTPGITRTVLLHTSEYSRSSPTPVLLDLGIATVEPRPEFFDRALIPVAVLLEGRFRSLYEGRLTAAFREVLTASGLEFSAESRPARQIVISDGDLAANDIDVTGVPLPLGYYKYTRETFANRDFLLNCIEYLVDDAGLIASRNKETTNQMLDKQIVSERKGMWQVLNIGVPLLFMLIAGGAVRMRRRKFVV
jgi:ABC-2 type transport system permease protein